MTSYFDGVLTFGDSIEYQFTKTEVAKIKLYYCLHELVWNQKFTRFSYRPQFLRCAWQHNVIHLQQKANAISMGYLNVLIDNLVISQCQFNRDHKNSQSHKDFDLLHVYISMRENAMFLVHNS